MPFVANRRLEDLVDPDAGARATRRMADKAGELLVDNTRRNTPINHDTFNRSEVRPPGTARESIEQGPTLPAIAAGGRGFQTSAFTRDPVFPYIEWDTRPHKIKPRKDRAEASVVDTRRPRRMGDDPQAALSWLGPGGRVFAREVNHPGTKGQHPFSIGAAITEAEFAGHMEDELDRFGRDVVPSRTGRVINLRGAG